MQLYRLYYDDYEEETIAICDSLKRAEELRAIIVESWKNFGSLNQRLSIDEYPLNEIPVWSVYHVV